MYYKAGKRGSLIVPEEVQRVILLQWNGFVFQVKGFGCVQNQVLSIHGKNAKWIDNLSTCIKFGEYTISHVCHIHKCN